MKESPSEPTFKFRTRYLIQPKFQLLFSGLLILIAFVCAILVGGCIYILVYTHNLIFVRYNVHTSPAYLTLLNKEGSLIVFAWIASFLIVALILFIAGIFLSHRISGPLYALMREMRKLKEGNLTAHLTLRKKDEFKELKIPFNQWVDSFRKMTFDDIQKMNELYQGLEDLLRKLEKDQASVEDTSQIKNTLSSLSILMQEKNRQLGNTSKS